MVDDQLTTDPVTVRKARTTFNCVRADSLSRTDSRSSSVHVTSIRNAHTRIAQPSVRPAQENSVPS